MNGGKQNENENDDVRFALSALCSFYVCHSKAETKIWKQDYEAYGRKISINIPVDDMGMDKN